MQSPKTMTASCIVASLQCNAAKAVLQLGLLIPTMLLTALPVRRLPQSKSDRLHCILLNAFAASEVAVQVDCSHYLQSLSAPSLPWSAAPCRYLSRVLSSKGMQAGGGN